MEVPSSVLHAVPAKGGSAAAEVPRAWQFDETDSFERMTPQQTFAPDPSGRAAYPPSGYNFDAAFADKVVVGAAANRALVEEFRKLAAILHHAQQERGIRSVMVASAAPAEGKTLISTNLALTLSHSYQRRVLLIDADLRRPNLSKFVPADKKGRGLTACLVRSASILDCCKATGIENLSILPAGERASKPAELLASSDFAGLFKEAVLHFDRVVLDSAPINAVSDTQLIARDVQSVCFVVRAGKIPRRAVVRACSLLAQAGSNPDGIVFNRIARVSRDRYYFTEYAGDYVRAGAEYG